MSVTMLSNSITRKMTIAVGALMQNPFGGSFVSVKQPGGFAGSG
jgi:hypothetical protein